jgi:hypothetical protein
VLHLPLAFFFLLSRLSVRRGKAEASRAGRTCLRADTQGETWAGKRGTRDHERQRHEHLDGQLAFSRSGVRRAQEKCGEMTIINQDRLALSGSFYAGPCMQPIGPWGLVVDVG